MYENSRGVCTCVSVCVCGLNMCVCVSVWVGVASALPCPQSAGGISVYTLSCSCRLIHSDITEGGQAPVGFDLHNRPRLFSTKSKIFTLAYQ